MSWGSNNVLELLEHKIQVGAKKQDETGGKNENLYQSLLYPTKELGPCSVGTREPQWISKLSDVIRFTSLEAGV